MRETFENNIGPELDSLYRAAILLSGGRPGQAERVLTSSILSAFLSWRSGGGTTPAVELVEQKMARVIMEHDGGQGERGPLSGQGLKLVRLLVRRRTPGPPHDPTAPAPMPPGVHDLMRAARGLPARSRIAFWYAVLERRSYAEIGVILGCSPREVAGFVREGQRGMHALLESTSEARGETDSGGPAEGGRSLGLP